MVILSKNPSYCCLGVKVIIWHCKKFIYTFSTGLQIYMLIANLSMLSFSFISCLAKNDSNLWHLLHLVVWFQINITHLQCYFILQTNKATMQKLFRIYDATTQHRLIMQWAEDITFLLFSWQFPGVSDCWKSLSEGKRV